MEGAIFEDVQLKFLTSKTLPEFTDSFLNRIIIYAIKDLYGDVGLAKYQSKFEITDTNPQSLEAKLRVDPSARHDIWNALTLLDSFDGEKLRIVSDQEFKAQ
mmetsp:Transcript_42834/g.49235  ORF Transcript_42834/g.49235 Transcript_42834/m.49235 type:complete len:102 (+) Transcript_42834:245-550(+)